MKIVDDDVLRINEKVNTWFDYGLAWVFTKVNLTSVGRFVELQRWTSSSEDNQCIYQHMILRLKVIDKLTVRSDIMIKREPKDQENVKK